ncbi:MAG TPA: hypothetical protein HPP83_10105 [Candidatus Hydrogenedentes bacterium]|nr:hypothetical protein [Candidatus Hydrogenedentota bacterium]
MEPWARYACAAVALFALAGCVPGRAAIEPTAPDGRFVQDRFAIGLWVDPPMDERADGRYAELAGAHFSMVIGGFGARTPEDVEKQLELCARYDMKAVVKCTGVPAEKLAVSSACWGYSLRDEPNAAEFGRLRKQVDAIRAARPGKLVYINLFPNYASPEQLGTATYDEYVARFVDEVDVDVLSMDHYPIFKPGADGRAAYCANLEVMRKCALERCIPFWNFFNTMPYGHHTDPTEAQLRWQVFTSLAYGAKGVMYFCYYTPAGGEFPKGGAIISRDDRRANHYYQARRINQQLKNLGPTLMQLTSTGVYRITPEDNPARILAGSPIPNIVHSPHDPKPDYLVGVFRHTDGRRAVLLNNYRFAYAAWPTVEFDADLSNVIEVDKWSGKEVPVVDGSPDMDGLQLPLDAAEGRLFLLACD